MFSYQKTINHLEFSYYMPGGGKKLIWDFWKAQVSGALVIQDIQVHCSNSAWKDTGVSEYSFFNCACPRASSSSWSQPSAAEEISGFEEIVGFLKGEWLNVGCWGVGGMERVPPWIQIVLAADILTNLCRNQPSGILQDFLQEICGFDLGIKRLPFLPGEARKLRLLSSKHFYLHWPPSASALEVGEKVEMGWKGKRRSDDECWLRGLDFILGPVKSLNGFSVRAWNIQTVLWEGHMAAGLGLIFIFRTSEHSW